MICTYPYYALLCLVLWMFFISWNWHLRRFRHRGHKPSILRHQPPCGETTLGDRIHKLAPWNILTPSCEIPKLFAILVLLGFAKLCSKPVVWSEFTCASAGFSFPCQFAGLDDLMSRLSLEEKIQQITPDSSLGGLVTVWSMFVCTHDCRWHMCIFSNMCVYQHYGMTMDEIYIFFWKKSERERVSEWVRESDSEMWYQYASSKQRQNIGAEHCSLQYDCWQSESTRTGSSVQLVHRLPRFVWKVPAQPSLLARLTLACHPGYG